MDESGTGRFIGRTRSSPLNVRNLLGLSSPILSGQVRPNGPTCASREVRRFLHLLPSFIRRLDHGRIAERVM